MKKKLVSLALAIVMVVGSATTVMANPAVDAFNAAQVAKGEAEKAALLAQYEAYQARLRAFWASQLGDTSVADFQAAQKANTSVADFQAAQLANTSVADFQAAQLTAAGWLAQYQAAQLAEAQARWAARYAAAANGLAVNVD